jgi:UPF0755 protein
LKPASRLAVRLILVGLVATILAVAGGVAWAYLALNQEHAAWDGASIDVVIPNGISASETISRLAEAGVIRDPRLLTRWLALSGGGGSIHAGEYRFEQPSSALAVLDRLERGDVLLHAVTIPEGLDLIEIAERIEQEGFGEKETLIAVFRDPAPIRGRDDKAPDLEGYLFPETYHFPRGASVETITRTMVERFWHETGEDFPTRATEAGLTLREAVTLASLIERETSLPEERGRISRVFHNRLERRMRLQCDPTVIYALRREGREVGRLTYRDLEFDSPWNTYVSYGLPPGPIASPGKASLDAAVAPDEGRELYFVAAPEGGHRFSATLDAHLQAVDVWRRYSRSSR